MKKIMFNDKYGLTQAVLEGRKTQTRRIVPEDTLRKAMKVVEICGGPLERQIELQTPYCYGEEVAVAQSYKEVCYSPSVQETIENELGMSAEDSAGHKNKMFVRADLMPHHIKITNLRIERLQDISEEDCLKEGIYLDYSDRDWDEGDDPAVCYRCTGIPEKEFGWPEKAFAYLIDKVSGKGTWESNPYVFVYDFELVR